MSLNLDPIFAVEIGSILWLILIIIAVALSILKKKYRIDGAHIMRVWQLVEIFGGMLFGFLFGGSVS